MMLIIKLPNILHKVKAIPHVVRWQGIFFIRLEIVIM